MSNNMTALAERRAQLIEQCQAQRACLAQEVAALRSPLSLGALRGRLAVNPRIVLAAAGIAAGFVLTRPRRMLALAGRGATLLGAARKLLPLLHR
jgi:hypothetical protein